MSAIVLYTSLGGTTYPSGAPGMIALLLAGLAMLVAFVLVESRVQNPILPRTLFRNRVYATTCAIAFGVAMALFGSVTTSRSISRSLRGTARPSRGYS